MYTARDDTVTAVGAVRNSPSWDPAATHRFVTGDGTALHVETAGPDDAEVTVVFVHGWTQDLRTWDAVLPRLAGEHPVRVRTLRYDLRGHGGSAPATVETATVAQAADDLAELVADRAPDGKLVLVGHSMGGMTIMALAQRHPELVRRRVAAFALVATAAEGMDRLTLGLRGGIGDAARRGEKRIFRALERRRKPFPKAVREHPGLLRPGTRWLVFGRRPRRADVALTAQQTVEAFPASLAWYRYSIADHDRLDVLASLREKPSVVMVGGRDRLCPTPRAELMARELPGAEYVRLPGAGHMLPYERADEVAQQVGRLVTESLTAERSTGRARHA
jgi:pimeloyl-ACP methyl ester carboxylesterase